MFDFFMFLEKGFQVGGSVKVEIREIGEVEFTKLGRVRDIEEGTKVAEGGCSRG